MSSRKSRRGGRFPAGAPRPVPRLRPHKTGQAFARWRERGRERNVYFGVWGTPSTKDAYRRWASVWIEKGPPQPDAASAETIPVADVLLRWLDWCMVEYRKFGRLTTAYKQCRLTAILTSKEHGGRLLNGDAVL